MGQTRWWDGVAWTEHIALPPPDPAYSLSPSSSHRRGLDSGRRSGSGRHRATEEPRGGVSAGWVAIGILGTVVMIAGAVALRSSSAQSDTATPQRSTPSVPATVLLLSESGTGDRALPAFSTTGRWQLQYSFDCGNLGRRGSFQILAEPPTERAVLVNELGTSVSKIFVADSGPGPKSLLVKSPCGWVLTISQRPNS